MHTPVQRQTFFMPMFAHEGDGSLDAIASKFYGREYIGQQTGQKLPNDSHVVYEMDDEAVLDRLHELEYERESSGVDSLTAWRDAPEPSDRSAAIALLRSAPEPDYVLADLISKGELPYGTYVLEVSW